MKQMLQNVNKKSILIMALFATITVLMSCGKDGEGSDPDPSTVNADFTATVDLDDSFLYTFTNSTVILGIDDLTGTYAWDFGGDGTSTDENPSHTFSAAGDYTVSLTVTAADGETGTATETISVTAPKNKYASITDAYGDDNLDPNGNTDTGELRLAFASTDSIREGRATFMYRVHADGKDGFMHLAGTSGTGDFAIMEVRIKDNEGSHEFREGASDATISAASFPDAKIDTWVPVEVSWSADNTNAPTFSLSMDGQVVTTDAVSTTNGGDGDVADHLEATRKGMFYIAWKYNDNGGIDSGTFEIDDIVVYSSNSGTEVEVFSDDFQGYAEGTDLDLDSNASSPYHGNTATATVAEED